MYRFEPCHAGALVALLNLSPHFETKRRFFIFCAFYAHPVEILHHAVCNFAYRPNARSPPARNLRHTGWWVEFVQNCAHLTIFDDFVFCPVIRLDHSVDIFCTTWPFFLTLKREITVFEWLHVTLFAPFFNFDREMPRKYSGPHFGRLWHGTAEQFCSFLGLFTVKSRISAYLSPNEMR